MLVGGEQRASSKLISCVSSYSLKRKPAAAQVVLVVDLLARVCCSHILDENKSSSRFPVFPPNDSLYFKAAQAG